MTTTQLNPQFWWWLARASGLVAWCVVTAGIVWGLALAARVVRRRRVPAWLLDLHRYLGTLALAFVGVHLIALAADSYVGFGLRDLFVPMASTWRPGAVAVGIVAFYLLVIVQLTSWLMNRLPRRLWHSIHLSSFAVLAGGTLHGALAGADRGNTFVQFGALSGATVVATLAIFRVLNLADREVRGTSRPAGAEDPLEPRRARSARALEVAPVADGVDPTPSAVDPELAARLARLGSRVKKTATG